MCAYWQALLLADCPSLILGKKMLPLPAMAYLQVQLSIRKLFLGAPPFNAASLFSQLQSRCVCLERVMKACTAQARDAMGGGPVVGLRAAAAVVCCTAASCTGIWGLCSAPRGASALRLAVSHMVVIAGSAAVSCCRDRVVSARTVSRRTPRAGQLAFRFRAAGGHSTGEGHTGACGFLLAIISCGDS
jgi:hypothetical protein